MPEIEIVPDETFLAERACRHFVTLARATLRTHRFAVALAGGSTPRGMYSLLVGARLDWEQVHFFWGDERCVPPDDPDSDFRMANETLLSHIPVPAGNIHRILGEHPAEEAAWEYEHELTAFFDEGIPCFDLVLLGLGNDGHTASLFPGAPALHETTRRAVAVSHDSPPPPLVDRVTLTPPVFKAAAEVLFLVAGAEKAERLEQVLHGPYLPDLLPAQLIRPVNGRLRWLVDRAAARDIH